MASIDDLSFDRPGLRPARPPLPPSLVGSISSVLLHNTSGSDALGPWNSCVTHRMWLSSVFSCPRSRHLGPLRPHACGSYRQTPLIHTTCKIARCNPNIRAQRGPLDLGSSRPPEAEATLIHRPPYARRCAGGAVKLCEALRGLARPARPHKAPRDIAKPARRAALDTVHEAQVQTWGWSSAGGSVESYIGHRRRIYLLPQTGWRPFRSAISTAEPWTPVLERRCGLPAAPRRPTTVHASSASMAGTASCRHLMHGFCRLHGFELAR